MLKKPFEQPISDALGVVNKASCVCQAYALAIVAVMNDLVCDIKKL